MVWPWHGHDCGGRQQDEQLLGGGRVQGGLHEVILCNLSFVNSHRSPTVIGHTILINFTFIKIKKYLPEFPDWTLVSAATVMREVL